MTISADKTLSRNEQALLEYLIQHSTITNKEARELIALKETATKNLLKKMCDKQILVAKVQAKG